jgi:flagellar protein FliO/FliZ
MFDFLFGEGQYGLRFVFAFIVVLGLIALTTWLVRRFGGDRLGAAAARGRQPRLAVIDAAAVDGRRRLILIRRDNVEHLLMIGGPTDLVVEPNIVRAAGAPRESVPGRTPAVVEAVTRAAALTESPREGTLWPLQPQAEPTPTPMPAPRAPRPIVAEEPAWQSEPEPPQRPSRQGDPLAGLAAELARQPAFQEPPPVPRTVRERPRERDVAREREVAMREREAAREAEREAAMEREAALERDAAAREREAALERDAAAREREAARERDAARELAAREREGRIPQAAAAGEAAFAPNADQNLAEMAQRLEAALRRSPRTAEARTPEPRAADPAPITAAMTASPSAFSAIPTPEPETAPAEPRPARTEPRPLRAEPMALRAEPREPRPGQPKSLYDSLEQEMADMASMLTRPNSKP